MCLDDSKSTYQTTFIREILQNERRIVQFPSTFIIVYTLERLCMLTFQKTNNNKAAVLTNEWLVSRVSYKVLIQRIRRSLYREHSSKQKLRL